MRALALLGLTALVGCAQPAQRVTVVTPDGVTAQYVDCNTGCAAPDPNSKIPRLEHDEMLALFEQYAAEPFGNDSLALDTLLYHGEQARMTLDLHVPEGTLSAEQEAFLRDELAKTHAEVEMRVVDETGQTRALLARTDVPFGIKQHLELDTVDLGHLETGGTVKRVGLHHLWSRW